MGDRFKTESVIGMGQNMHQTLLPQAKAVALPVQDLDLVALAVAEHKQLLGKRIVLQGLFDQNRQSVDAFAKVDNIPAQIDSG